MLSTTPSPKTLCLTISPREKGVSVLELPDDTVPKKFALYDCFGLTKSRCSLGISLINLEGGL